MIYVVAYEFSLGFADGLLYRLQLRSNIDTRPSIFDHGNHATQMTLSATQTLNDRRMALMGVIPITVDVPPKICFLHARISDPPGGDV